MSLIGNDDDHALSLLLVVISHLSVFCRAMTASDCSTRPEDFTDLSLDFPPKPEGSGGRARTLLDCLAHFTTSEEIEMRCEKCGKMGAALSL